MYTVQRDVVVAGHDHLGHPRQAVEELPGVGKLSSLRALREISAGHDDVGLQSGGRSQQGVAHLGQVDRPKVQIGDVQ